MPFSYVHSLHSMKASIYAINLDSIITENTDYCIVTRTVVCRLAQENGAHEKQSEYI